MLVLKIKDLNCFESLTDSGLSTTEVLSPVDESLEGVEIPFVLREECAWVASLFIQSRHWHPLVVENVKFLAISDHLILFVATSHNVNVPVFELVVSCEGSSRLGDRLQVLDFVG